jgi:hypothetical protein
MTAHEDGSAVIEVDHTGDDPGPETILTGEIRPLEGIDE